MNGDRSRRLPSSSPRVQPERPVLKEVVEETRRSSWKYGLLTAALIVAWVFYDGFANAGRGINAICAVWPEAIRPSPPCLPQSAATPAVDEIRATRKALEDKLDKLAALPPGRSATPPPPLHQAFQVTPTWFTNDLTVSLRKVATDTGGTLRVFACSRSSSRMSFVGEMAYAASQDSKSFTALFSEPFAVLLLQVDPSRGTPTSIIAPWDLKTQTRLKEPVSRPGLLNCNDIIGKF